MLYLISYDLDKPGQDYNNLIGRLETLRAKKVLYSQWFLNSASSALDIANDLVRFMDANDRILVCEIQPSTTAYRNLMIPWNVATT